MLPTDQSVGRSIDLSDPISRLNTALEGRYHIERELGEGGMATVYLARDEKHNRNVALKVLKSELAAMVGAERFLAEIETTANLQHPHILPLFDSGEADGFLFYVMPYVEGETLRERIDRDKQLPVDEALGIATAVSNALQTAHDAGVIHRDIKPGNILLSRGEPLVADFGIALAVGGAGGSRLTETGLSVGTPYYMSPEQATGDQVIGPASDTYAVACVLYEMLTGEPPYLGNTAQAVLGKIIQGIPVSTTSVRKAVPPNVDAAIRKALERLPADRFTGAQNFSKALADPGFRHGEDLVAAGAAAGPWKRLSLATSAVALVALIMTAFSFTRDPVESGGLMRQRIAPFAPGLARAVGAFTTLAPDGSGMVYAVPEGADWQLWFKSRDAAEPTLLTGTAGGQNPVYSPDAEWIAFAAGPELKKRPIGDGSTITLAEGLTPPGVASMVATAWQDDGTILYEMPGATLMRIPDVGGLADTVAVYSEQGFTNLAWVGGLPGSRGALVTLCPGPCAGGLSLLVADFEADTTRLLLDDVARGWYTPTGQLIYVRTDGAVFAAPFDLDALELTGPGLPLFEGVQLNTSTPELAVAWDGTVLYATGEQTNQGSRELIWVDRSGDTELVDPSLTGATYFSATLSPNDDRVALAMVEAGGTGTSQLWVKELPDGPLTRLTTTTGSSTAGRPVWSQDGRSISFIADNTDDVTFSHARSIAADGSSEGVSDVLLEHTRPVREVFFTPDERGLLFRQGVAGQGTADLGFLDLQTGSIDETLLASDFDEFGMSLSPDGRWMAYSSDASGRPEIFVRPFPEGTSRVQVSANGGRSPVWAHNGRELFFSDADGVMAVATYRTEPSFAVESRDQLFSVSEYTGLLDWRAFDISSDDERFLMVSFVGRAQMPEDSERIILVQNYFEELRERVSN